MKLIKLIALLMILGLLGIISLSSNQVSKANGDEALEQIAKYKTWTKVSKDPIKVEVTIGGAEAG
ncbi:MAG TPA: hypothetical protein PKY82_24385 [Pyrinomonadaceae bacterium]|nr:hypothetical protein [Pyrinomonadaceae bacterium]